MMIKTLLKLKGQETEFVAAEFKEIISTPVTPYSESR